MAKLDLGLLIKSIGFVLLGYARWFFSVRPSRRESMVAVVKNTPMDPSRMTDKKRCTRVKK